MISIMYLTADLHSFLDLYRDAIRIKMCLESAKALSKHILSEPNHRKRRAFFRFATVI